MCVCVCALYLYMYVGIYAANICVCVCVCVCVDKKKWLTSSACKPLFGKMGLFLAGDLTFLQC